MTEHREAQRQRTLKSGLIVFNEAHSTIACTVRNLSRGGAQLKVASVVGIPASFDLRLADKTTHHCVIAWRKAEEIGVKFL